MRQRTQSDDVTPCITWTCTESGQTELPAGWVQKHVDDYLESRGVGMETGPVLSLKGFVTAQIQPDVW